MLFVPRGDGACGLVRGATESCVAWNCAPSFRKWPSSLDVLDELVRFAVEHLVAAVDGKQRERLGDVALARARFTNDGCVYAA
jgi:hypothetical protein